MRLTVTLCLLVVLGSCSGSSGNHAIEQDRTVTRLGGTCGQWQVEPSGSPTLTLVRATCAQGMTCVEALAVNPPDELGNRFGTCLPEAALRCDPAQMPTGCPQDLACWFGPGITAPGRCFVSCSTSRDCEAPYQVCRSSTCEFRRCPLPGETDGTAPATCPADSRCERGICVQK